MCFDKQDVGKIMLDQDLGSYVLNEKTVPLQPERHFKRLARKFSGIAGRRCHNRRQYVGISDKLNLDVVHFL